MILLSSGSAATGGSPIYCTLPLVTSLQFFCQRFMYHTTSMIETFCSLWSCFEVCFNSASTFLCMRLWSLSILARDGCRAWTGATSGGEEFFGGSLIFFFVKDAN